MKITAIKRQVKRTDRYSVYGDGKYLFSLGESELLATGLRVNQEFSPNELEEVRTAAMLDKGYDRALNLISHRPRSEGELRDYLKRKAYAPDVATAIIERLRERGYVDDKDFAERWVATRRLLKTTNKRRLGQELKQKKVSEDIIQEVLNADDTDEHQLLRELVSRKRQQTKYQDDLKLMQYLSRQGFNYDDIKAALRDEKA